MSREVTMQDGPSASLAPPMRDGKRLRHAFGQFATGVCVVAARDRDGRKLGVTANSFTSVSIDPPLLLVCIARRMWSHDPLVACEGFAVSVLHHAQRDLSAAFAAQGGDKWQGVACEEGVAGGLIVHPSLAFFDCMTFARYAGGDHTILVGEVHAHSQAHEGDPLLYFRGDYAGLHPTTPPAPPSSGISIERQDRP